jgi:RNA-binding protein
MESLSKAQREHLRKLAHALKPVVQIGKSGLTAQVKTSIDQALSSKELIKIKFINHKMAKQEMAAEIVQVSDSVLVGVIGNVAIFYRPHPQPDKRKIVLP